MNFAIVFASTYDIFLLKKTIKKDTSFAKIIAPITKKIHSVKTFLKLPKVKTDSFNIIKNTVPINKFCVKLKSSITIKKTFLLYKLFFNSLIYEIV